MRERERDAKKEANVKKQQALLPLVPLLSSLPLREARKEANVRKQQVLPSLPPLCAAESAETPHPPHAIPRRRTSTRRDGYPNNRQRDRHPRAKRDGFVYPLSRPAHTSPNRLVIFTLVTSVASIVLSVTSVTPPRIVSS